MGRNTTTDAHRDLANTSGSMNLTLSLGDFTGGQLLIENVTGNTPVCMPDGVLLESCFPDCILHARHDVIGNLGFPQESDCHHASVASHHAQRKGLPGPCQLHKHSVSQRTDLQGLVFHFASAAARTWASPLRSARPGRPQMHRLWTWQALQLSKRSHTHTQRQTHLTHTHTHKTHSSLVGASHACSIE